MTQVVKEVTENYGVAPAGGSRGGRVARVRFDNYDNMSLFNGV